MSFKRAKNVAETLRDEAAINTEVDDESPSQAELADEVIRQRIIYCLRIYPRVSMSMLQVGIGTSVPPKEWKRVLAKMTFDNEVGVVTETHLTPTGRVNTHNVICLDKTFQKSLPPMTSFS